MNKKRRFVIVLGLIGFMLLFISMINPMITGATIGSNITGTNITSRVLGGLGLLLMIIAIMIENYELKRLRREKVEKISKK